MKTFITKKHMSALAGLSVLASLSCSQLALAASAPTLTIENFIGTVNLETGNFKDITVVDADGAKVEHQGGNVAIDDEREINNLQCKNRSEGLKKLKIGHGRRWFGKAKNYKLISAYPSLTIKAPIGTHVKIEKSLVFGHIDTIGSGEIHIGSCSTLNFANVTGRLNLHVSGIADVGVGNVGDADIRVSGASDLEIGDISNLELHVSGASDTVLGNVAGTAGIHASGASEISLGRIEDGLEYDGSGATNFKALAVSGDTLSVRASGSSDFSAKAGRVDEVYIRASGASDITYKGTSVDADVKASGASDILIHHPSGHLRESDSGAGDVHIIK